MTAHALGASRRGLNLLRIALSDPAECLDHIRGYIEGCLDAGRYTEYDHLALDAFARRPDLPPAVARLFASYDRPDLAELLEGVARRRNDDPDSNLRIDGSLDLGRLAFLVTDALRAETVVEVGVGRGVTSLCILAAMHANGVGRLHSIDLPPLRSHDREGFTGSLVPDALRDRWTLIRGSSRRALPRLMEALGSADMMLIDGLHTHRTMAWDLRQSLRLVRLGGAVVADDIHFNPAFREFARHERVAFAQAFRASGDPRPGTGPRL